jgi:hypothetical protein
MECGKQADNMPTDEELIKQRDSEVQSIIDGEIIKKLRGNPNNLLY